MSASRSCWAFNGSFCTGQSGAGYQHTQIILFSLLFPTDLSGHFLHTTKDGEKKALFVRHRILNDFHLVREQNNGIKLLWEKTGQTETQIRSHSSDDKLDVWISVLVDVLLVEIAQSVDILLVHLK